MNLRTSVARRVRRLLSCCALASGLQACAQETIQQDPAAHHTTTGFQNTHVADVSRGLGDLLRWRWNAWRNKLPPEPQIATPVQAPELAQLSGYSKAWEQRVLSGTAPAPTVTWLGHATALVQAGGLQVLTDPVFSERASPVSWAGPRRAQPPGVAIHDLPPIDVVVISHSHYDHLDKDSVVQLYERSQRLGHPTVFLVPLGLQSLLTGWGITGVQELDWWQSARVAYTDFFLTPVQHWSARGLFDRNRTLWGGWAVFAPDLHWYFAGDTGYSPDFVQTRQHFAHRQTPEQGGPFDLALIPVGAYEPRWFMRQQHVNPAEAVQIHQDLGVKRSMGVHWGTFALTDEPLDQPASDLHNARAAAHLSDEDFFLLAVGQTRTLPGRAAGTRTAP